MFTFVNRFFEKFISSWISKYMKLMRDTTNEVLLALKNLNCPTDQWDHLLIHLLVDKLNKNSIADWEKHLASRSDYPKYEDFQKFRDKKIRTFEVLQMSKDTLAY